RSACRAGAGSRASHLSAGGALARRRQDRIRRRERDPRARHGRSRRHPDFTREHRMRLLGLFIALLASLAAASQPARVESEYVITASGGITIGRAKASFTRTGDTYSIRSETRSDGALKVFLDDQFTSES